MQFRLFKALNDICLAGWQILCWEWFAESQMVRIFCLKSKTSILLSFVELLHLNIGLVLLSVWSSNSVHVGFIRVHWFPPSAKEHAVYWWLKSAARCELACECRASRLSGATSRVCSCLVPIVPGIGSRATVEHFEVSKQASYTYKQILL